MFAWNRMHAVTRVLSQGEVVSMRSSGRRSRITCVEGRLWVTISGRESDTLLAGGEEMTSTDSGRIVIEALLPATVRVEPLTRERVKPGLLSPQPAH